MNPYKEYKVYGSKLPSTQAPSPQIYVMQVFAKNEVAARSTFFHVLKKQHKIKSTNGCILKIVPVVEQISHVRPYGIRFTYRSKKNTHNMYKEFRGVSRVDVVNDMYNDMAGRHSVGRTAIDIVSVKELNDDEIRRENVKILGNTEIEFPVFKKFLARQENFVEEGGKYFY